MPSTLLTIEDVATELSVSSIAVHRIIARGSLIGNEIGQQKFTVDPDDLRKYVSDGCPDLAMPETLNGWLRNTKAENAASGFQNTIAQMIENDIEAGRLKKPTRSGDVISVLYAGEIKSYCEGRPARLARMQGESDRSELARKDAYAIVRLHKIAQSGANKLNAPGGSGLKGLYSSPKRYSEITSEAFFKHNQSSISITRYFTGDRPDKKIRGVYVLEIEDMGLKRRSLIDRAF